MTSLTDTPSKDEPVRDNERLFFLMKLRMSSGKARRQLKMMFHNTLKFLDIMYEYTHPLSESVLDNTEVYSPDRRKKQRFEH